jgi:hypothetical protein
VTGAYSIFDRHCDQHAPIKTVKCEFGLKYWIFWDPLSEDQLRAASKEAYCKEYELGVAYFDWLKHPRHSLLIRLGDAFAMIPLTFHLVLSLEPTLLIGNIT